MRVHMRERPTEGLTDIIIEAPQALAQRIAEAVEKLVALAEAVPLEQANRDDETVTWEEAFPDRHPGHVLAGARYRENLSRKELAAAIGVKTGHIAEMEAGKRPIGKEMAKRLAEALNTSYKVFL